MINKSVKLTLIFCLALTALTFAQAPDKKPAAPLPAKPAGSPADRDKPPESTPALPEKQDEAGAILFKKVDPSVVAIQHEQAGGSGFIVDSTGYIITNGHVVSSALGWRGVEDPTETAKRITVILSDERKYQARVIGHCLDPDVALIKIEAPEPLPTVELGDSDNVKVGQRSYAFGMPLGMKRTLTAGIVSNVERTDLGTFTKVIQTDAPINPGNSGGPLFNEKGEVIGMNTYGIGWGAEGLGFTIPINVAKVLKEHFLKYGHFKRAVFPFFVPKELDKDFARVLGVSEGILIDYVETGTTAQAAGLQMGDIIIEMNGNPVSAPNKAALQDAVWKFVTQPVGSKIDLKIKRKSGEGYKELVISGIMVEDEPSIRYGHQIGEVKEIRYDVLGLRVEQITALSRYINNLVRPDGVRVTNAIRGDPAEKGGIQSNDIILELNDIKIKNTEEFQKELDKLVIGKPKYIRVLVQRRQDIVKALLKPNYDLKDKKVVLVVPEEGVEYFERIRRYFITNGATTLIAGAKDKVKSDGKEITVDVLLSDLPSDYHGLIFLSGKGVESYWTNEKVHQLVKSANQDKKVLGAIGAAAPILIYSDEALLKKKLTCDKDNAQTMLDKKANYTGNDIESDENIYSTTGFNKEIIDGFLVKIKSPIQDFSPASQQEKETPPAPDK